MLYLLKDFIVSTKPANRYLILLLCCFLYPSSKTIAKDLEYSKAYLPNVNEMVDQVFVTGTVTDEDGVPLPGATVIEVGTNNGTQADFDGNFTLEVSNLEVTLRVSYIGYVSQNVALSGSNTVNVSLKEDVAKLDEVIVVGYSTQEKGNVSSAISTVSADDIAGRPVANIEAAIQGQIPGIAITNSTGAPGGAANVVIRGVGTINGGSNPLYVIDGNIISTNIGNQGPAFTAPNPLATINPSDIESVSVLKDAAAAAIYGARAANGVIIITTKRGSSGKAKFNFNTYYGFQTATNTLDLLNAQQYQQVQNAARDNAGIARIPSLDGTTLTTDTDWQDEVLRTAPISSYELSASGGGENTRYYTSLSYFNQEGIVIGTGLERFSARFNSDTRLGKFKLGNSLVISRSVFDKESTTNVRSILNSAITNQPNIPVFDPNAIGGFAGPTPDDGEPTVNPVAAQRLVTNENTVTRILGSFYGQYDITKNLTFKVNTAIDLVSFHDRFAAPLFEQGGLQIPGFEDGAQVSEARGESNSFILENTLKYRNDFGKHSVEAIAGYTVQEEEFENLNARVVGQFTGSGLPVINGSNDIRDFGGTIVRNNTTSIIGSVLYDYDDKYLATFNFRRDGSSRFIGDNIYDNFLSGSVGWHISKEYFMKDSFISDLKLRGSYGALGNDAIDANATRFTLNSNATYVLGTGQVLTPGVAPQGALQNSELGWERQKQLNIGLDLGLFDNKFTLTADYFNKTSEDLLLTVPVPLSSGFEQITINAGEVSNKGLEVIANYRDRIGEDFTFGVGFNFTTIDNNVESLTNGLEAIDINTFGAAGSERVRIAPGNPVGSFYGFVVDGIFQSQAEIDSAPDQGFDGTAPGDFRYRDINGDGVIDLDDRTFLGNPQPDLLYGFNIQLGYKGFDFSAQFQGVAGNEIFSETKFESQSYARTNNLTTAVLDAWTPSNPSNTTPRALPQTVSDNDRVSSFFIEKGDYLRLQNAQFGYTFNNRVLETLGNLSNLRVYLAGQNLITISDYLNTGYDPEVGANGIDNVIYPKAMTLTVGLQVGF